MQYLRLLLVRQRAAEFSFRQFAQLRVRMRLCCRLQRRDRPQCRRQCVQMRRGCRPGSRKGRLCGALGGELLQYLFLLLGLRFVEYLRNVRNLRQFVFRYFGDGYVRRMQRL